MAGSEVAPWGTWMVVEMVERMVGVWVVWWVEKWADQWVVLLDRTKVVKTVAVMAVL
jgi:hypothetical protein